ncbi:hypothetical protein IFM89_030665 [Coptis chinensis]|uniref:Uncharacterized protein n=1 Tax=Coptis chinensis TaxID=261450 RepID=A0A835GZ29_9MAGN|nr:hypothetical protein IFM89_030665 [Coptis chinensis]
MFCLAPFWIFNLAAVNIDFEVFRDDLGVTGVVLRVFGLIWGRPEDPVRKRYNLRPNNHYYGSPPWPIVAGGFFIVGVALASASPSRLGMVNARGLAGFQKAMTVPTAITHSDGRVLCER